MLHYQPKSRSAAASVAGVEALVRWQHPERGLLPPGEFIPLAERTGLIGATSPTGSWRARSAQCARWREAGIELPVAVNLSGADLLDARLPERVDAALEAAGRRPASMLQCEISEDTVLADPQRAIASLRRLRAMGVQLSLDDFGNG